LSSVTLLDGIVCAPTATGPFRQLPLPSVMGKAEPVEAKLQARDDGDFVEYVIRGRWATVRPPTKQELRALWFLPMPLSRLRQGSYRLRR